MITKEMLAEHLAWFLSNSNHELQHDDTLIEISCNSWTRRAAPEVVELYVDAWNAETGERGSFEFTLTVGGGDRQPDDDEPDGA